MGIRGVWLQGIFYIIAGLNHFLNPEGYEKMITHLMDGADRINVIAGIVEIVLGLFLFFNRTRFMGCIGIVGMLVAFVPIHISMLKTGLCFEEYCAPKWLLWFRLLIIQPLLIYWAWRCRHIKT